MTFPREKVAITVPMSTRPSLLPAEEVSFRHLEHFLGGYDRYLILPEGSPLSRPGFRAKYFGPQFFGSAEAHTRLMLSKEFYESFSNYDYILNYHPDALVFSDDLQYWCEQGYDYIGPPWLKCDELSWVEEAAVGNGGFSLRRIEAFLAVLNSPRYWMKPSEYRAYFDDRHSGLQRLVRWPKKWLCHLKAFNNVRRHIERGYIERGLNEDKFWSFEARHYCSDFSIPSVEIALHFAFEVTPRKSYDKISRLPFGCHAWEKYDPDFWKEHLLQNTYPRPERSTA